MEDEIKIARMRTVKQCSEFFKQEDPETSITEYYLNTLVKQNKITFVMAGRKRLINLDKLIMFLNNGDANIAEEENNSLNKIRKIEE